MSKVRADGVVGAGALRHPLKVEKPVITADEDTGEEQETWLFQADIHGSVEPLSSRDRFKAAQMDTRITHRVVIRFLAGLDTTYRLLWRPVREESTRTLNVHSVINPSGRSRVMELLCGEDA